MYYLTVSLFNFLKYLLCFTLVFLSLCQNCPSLNIFLKFREGARVGREGAAAPSAPPLATALIVTYRRPTIRSLFYFSIMKSTDTSRRFLGKNITLNPIRVNLLFCSPFLLGFTRMLVLILSYLVVSTCI